MRRFNPYFIGLPILIILQRRYGIHKTRFQSLFYWITYSYSIVGIAKLVKRHSFNPYFIGLPILMVGLVSGPIKSSLVSILILLDYLFLYPYNPQPIQQQVVQVSILILLDYLFLLLLLLVMYQVPQGFNPYFIGLPILILV